MSRYYEMQVNIKEFKPEKRYDIENAADEEWDFGDNWDAFNHTLTSVSRGNLYGGEGEDEFARRLTHAIWKANGGYCKVEVIATCLEELPYERYELTQEDFNKANAYFAL